MWLMLQQDTPDDYVVATGEQHSVQEVAAIAFAHVGLDWQQHVRDDPSLLRPAEVEQLVGDASKARQRLGWQQSLGFQDLIALMVDADIERVRRETAQPPQRPDA
jgi:GDPmannose 4,6-dehydratase